jgi:hypothetical protein
MAQDTISALASTVAKPSTHNDDQIYELASKMIFDNDKSANSDFGSPAGEDTSLVANRDKINMEHLSQLPQTQSKPVI